MLECVATAAAALFEKIFDKYKILSQRWKTVRSSKTSALGPISPKVRSTVTHYSTTFGSLARRWSAFPYTSTISHSNTFGDEIEIERTKRRPILGLEGAADPDPFMRYRESIQHSRRNLRTNCSHYQQNVNMMPLFYAFDMVIYVIGLSCDLCVSAVL